MASVFILGSEGFIGSNLVKHFSDAGYDVAGCDLFETSFYGGYQYYKVTRLSPEWEEIFSPAGFDFCINAAGSGSVPYSMTHPVSDFEANTLDTIRILDVIRRLDPGCRYIHLSSAAVYGNPKKLPVNENDALSPLSPYGFHKLMAEQVCKEYYEVYNIGTAIVRPFSVYGEGLRKQLLWDVCSKLKKEKAIRLFGTGNESRDFLHVKDLAVLLQVIAEQSAFKADVYNAASGIESSLHSIARLFEEHYNGSGKITFSGEARPGDPINWRADISRTQALGFKPSIVLKQGLPQYIHWFQSL
jgi:dTDP-glucose 4,6-dehydratase/UDP-glucose 4-epimerase